MKIYLPSGYSSEFYTNNHYYQPGVYDESELPLDLVSYLIKEKFACYILEELADRLNALQAHQIPAEMQSIWDEYQAMLLEAQRTDTIVYPEERDRFRRDLWAVFSRMMGDR